MIIIIYDIEPFWIYILRPLKSSNMEGQSVWHVHIPLEYVEIIFWHDIWATEVNQLRWASCPSTGQIFRICNLLHWKKFGKIQTKDMICEKYIFHCYQLWSIYEHKLIHSTCCQNCVASLGSCTVYTTAQDGIWTASW